VSEPVRRRILIVENYPDSREALCMVFEGGGQEMEGAATGARAIAMAATWHPDIVVLDLGLPDMDGEEVAAAMKTMASPPFIVAFSGFHRRENRARAAGCDAFVLKPNVAQLITVVEARIEWHAKAEGAA
jgi:two-component system KDP operon response regulator KdpE